MRKLATLITAVALAMTLGFAGTVKADPTVNLLVNPGAEDGTGNVVVDDWNLSSAAAGRSSVAINFTEAPLTPDWFFTTALAEVGPSGSASLNQDVDISDCSAEGLDGLWSAGGWIETFPSADFGDLTITFFDDTPAQVGSATLNNLMSIGAYSPFSTSGTIPAGAVTANYMISGTEGSGLGIDVFADVAYDDLDFNVTCVTDFAKISGKIKGTGGKGHDGRAGQYSFAGTVGHFDDVAMTLAGEYLINYKVLGQSCVFTPTPNSLTFDGASATVAASYVCDDVATTSGNAVISLTQGVGGSNKNKDKDRGSVCVDADDNQLDIPTDPNCTPAGNAVDLDKGNVKVSPPPA